jgi:hypothetical protein
VRKAAAEGKAKLSALVAQDVEAAELEMAEKNDVTVFTHLGKALREKEERCMAAAALLQKNKSALAYASRTVEVDTRLKVRWAAGKTRVTGGGGGGGGGGGSSAASEDDVEDADLACAICLEIPEDESGAALAPCGHLFHTVCLAQWVLSKQMGWAPPPADHSTALFDAAAVAKQLKGSMGAPCPTCKKPFVVADINTVSAEAMEAVGASGGTGSEVEALPLQVAIERLAGGGGGGSAAAALPVPPSSAANAVALDVAEAAGGGGRRAKEKAAKGLDVYGGKIAALMRRLRLMPPGEKAVIATSWPHLRGVVARALREQGIAAVVIEGSPSEMASAVSKFTWDGDSATAPSLAAPPAPTARKGKATSPSTAAPADHLIKVVVLSLGTDCAGLTLTSANRKFRCELPSRTPFPKKLSPIKQKPNHP